MKPSSIALSLTLGLTASALATACGGNTGDTTTSGSGAAAGQGGTGSGAETGSGAAAGQGGSGGATGHGGDGGQGATGGSVGTGGSGGGQVCGGKSGKECTSDQVCDYDDPVPCGLADGTGTCKPRPENCTKDCPNVCGCDGMTYCNECMAHAAGVDVSAAGACAPAADCTQIVTAIAQQSGGVTTCTTLVRLDYQTLAIKSYHLACAPYAGTGEAQARATAQADTGFGQAGQLLSGANPEDEYVLWEAPGDFGGAGVVNARNGKTVFGGGVVWAGMGEITHPESFSPPASLGLGCTSTSQKPQARGFHLGGGQPLSQAEVDAAVDVVWSTALPDGLWQNSYVFDAMVLLYPPGVGVGDPAVTEWVVLVNSGWLE